MGNVNGIGGFQKGVSGNPAGRPSGSVDFAIRMKQLVEMYSAEEILALLKDKKKFGEMRAFDAMIIKRLAEGLADDGRQSMEGLFNRVMGMPTQHVKSENTDTLVMTTLAERKKAATKEADELLKKAAEGKKKK